MIPQMNALNMSRMEATQEIASAILKEVGAALVRHGPDPQGDVIVAASFVMALEMAAEIDPKIYEIVCRMLSTEKQT